MIIETIDGLKEAMANDPPQGSVTVVMGPPGSLKSTLVYYILAKMGEKGAKSLYVTVEQSPESIIHNVKSMNLDVRPEYVKMIDLGAAKYELKYNLSYLDEDETLNLILANMKDAINGEERLAFLGLDSLNALYILSSGGRKFRLMLERLFRTLREQKITSFLVLEDMGQDKGVEQFLADGVIQLDIVHRPEGRIRSFEIKKMRGVWHKLNPFLLDVENGRITLKGELIE